ncbi:uncharacterized protein LOC117321447 [Pecten maximus]|uniref:uncharacterized protein LOC117321447 n=1 Tax=Pecten maximus TaxID=6579 RepID=UPI001458A303|nr:uncharacterized protein LOC117321447 [Pecten maximus]
MGHSFVRRLSEFVSSRDAEWRNLRLEESSIKVSFLGKGGGRVSDLFSDQFRRFVEAVTPDVVILQIGGNDADCPSAEPRRLTINIFSIAEWLLGYGVKHVVIMQLLPRQLTRRVSPVVYNEFIKTVNQHIKRMASTRGDISYHKHKGLKGSPTNVFRRDGVHLNDAHGLPKYVRSVRGAVIVGARQLSS